MDKPKNKIIPPKGYVPLLGSEHNSSVGTKLLGRAEDTEIVKVTIVLRRRKDGPPIPDFDYYGNTPPAKHKRLSVDEFAATYGAHPDDIKKIVQFAEAKGMKVLEIHHARRTIVLSGTVALMNAAFAIVLHRFEHKVIRRRGEKPVQETFRGRVGFIHVPVKLVEIIIGIFGLDNCRITKRNSPDPPGTARIAMEKLKKLYNFPPNSATGQTIAVFSEGGYLPSDIKSNFPVNSPEILEINVDAVNDGTADAETTQDIFVVAAAATGADIAVYFTTPDQGGWLKLVNRVIHPEPEDPVCYVLSNSFYVSNSDDLGLLPPFSKNWMDAMTMVFQDAAIQKVTVCCASGDNGTDSKVGDKHAHVQYPASDPWVLTAGGTTIGNIHGNSFDEYVWNDIFDKDHAGATGGGVSAYFTKPSYQNKVRVPRSLNNGKAGRGLPDVAANASPNSGVPMIINGKPDAAIGTSASAPLWAALITIINAALGEPVGFINSHIYKMGSAMFRDITGAEGPADNGLAGAPGYPARKGWDACTGWGSPNGEALLKAFQELNGL